MNKEIKKYTLAFSLFCSVACAMIFHSQMLIEKADLEENTVDDVLKILRAEFEDSNS